MTLLSLLSRFTAVFIIAYIVLTILMIFIIAFLQLPQVLESYVSYVGVWLASFYVLNQYNEKNLQVMSKNQRWKIISLLTITAIIVGLIFSIPINSSNLTQDMMSLLMGVMIALPSYAVLIWSSEFRATKRLLKNHPELKSTESQGV
ncbi:MAG: hypothetical protein ISEC1_P1656 [Thiomicrorhabdus sp.]|nr:MAG: hypothetical protein ISEC1_P1656 [Thiomicrorhabdus sp.]